MLDEAVASYLFVRFRALIRCYRVHAIFRVSQCLTWKIKNAIERTPKYMPSPFIPVPNTALIEMVYQYQGIIIENTFHVTGSAPFTALQLSGLCNVFDAWDNAITGGKLLRVTQCTLTTIKARALDTASSPVFTFSLPVARAGSGGNSPQPGSVTFAIKLETGLAGRSFRGRTYIVAPPATGLQASPNANLFSTVYAASCVTAINLLISNITAATATNHLSVVSYRTGGAPRVTGVATTIINANFANLRVDTQRRRLS